MRKKSKNQPKMPFYFCKLVVEFSYIYEYIYPYNKNKRLYGNLFQIIYRKGESQTKGNKEQLALVISVLFAI